MKFPAVLTKGDSASWIDYAAKDNLGNLISSVDWVLTYAIRGAVSLNLTGVSEGNGWKTTMTAVQSATLSPGTYFWQAFASKSSTSERVTLGSGTLVIQADLASAGTGYDGKTQAETDLAAVQAAMRAIIAGGAVQEYSIAGRSIKKIPMTELIELESRYKVIVARERKAESIRNGLGNPHSVAVRFKK